MQYNASVSIIGAISGTSQEKLIPAIRFGITQEQKMLQAQVLFLKTYCNSKATISFQSDTFKLNSQFSIHHHVDFKSLVRFRLGFSLLREHKLRHNFHDTLNFLCCWSLQLETTSHYILYCRNFLSARSALMNDLNLTDPNIS